MKKVFENVMYNRILSSIKRHDILSPSQYGFLKGKSTESAIYKFIDLVLNGLDNQDNTLGVFYDLR